jgi:hypothetical protein
MVETAGDRDAAPTAMRKERTFSDGLANGLNRPISLKNHEL